MPEADREPQTMKELQGAVNTLHEEAWSRGWSSPNGPENDWHRPGPKGPERVIWHEVKPRIPGLFTDIEVCWLLPDWTKCSLISAKMGIGRMLAVFQSLLDAYMDHDAVQLRFPEEWWASGPPSLEGRRSAFKKALTKRNASTRARGQGVDLHGAVGTTYGLDTAAWGLIQALWALKEQTTPPTPMPLTLHGFLEVVLTGYKSAAESRAQLEHLVKDAMAELRAPDTVGLIQQAQEVRGDLDKILATMIETGHRGKAPTAADVVTRLRISKELSWPPEGDPELLKSATLHLQDPDGGFPLHHISEISSFLARYGLNYLDTRGGPNGGWLLVCVPPARAHDTEAVDTPVPSEKP